MSTMRNTTFSLFACAAMLLSAATANAQATVDIGLYRTGDLLEVRLRPTEDFHDILSAVVFTLRWDEQHDLLLPPIQQKSATARYIPLQPSVYERTATHRYQVYAGFGFESLNNANEPWRAGTEYTIARIPVPHGINVELVNDHWTGELTNNADFYISLNGRDRTGIIYKGQAPPEVPLLQPAILPNPNNGLFAIAHLDPQAGDLAVEVFDAAGRLVHTLHRQTITDGQRSVEVDLSAMASGTYQVKIVQHGELIALPVVVQR